MPKKCRKHLAQRKGTPTPPENARLLQPEQQIVAENSYAPDRSASATRSRPASAECTTIIAEVQSTAPIGAIKRNKKASSNNSDSSDNGEPPRKIFVPVMRHVPLPPEQEIPALIRRSSLDDSSSDDDRPVNREIVIEAAIIHCGTPFAVRQNPHISSVEIDVPLPIQEEPNVIPLHPIRRGPQLPLDLDEIRVVSPVPEPVHRLPVDQPPIVEIDEPIIHLPPDHPLIPVIIDRQYADIDVEQELVIFQQQVEIERQRQYVPTYLIAAEWNLNERQPRSHLGQMNHQCRHCFALHFKCETNTRRNYNKCCANNKVVLPELRPMPHLLRSLYQRNHPMSNHFISHILYYNYAFQFVSLEATSRDLPPGRAPPIYCIMGKIYHHISNVNVNEPNQRYGPVYFLTPQDAVDQKLQNNPNLLNRDLIDSLEVLFREINPYARAYMHLREVYNRELETIERLRRQNNDPNAPPLQMPTIAMEILSVRGRNNRHLDLPVAEEVAVVYRVDPDTPPTPNLCVYVRDHRDRFENLTYTNETCQPLTFLLIFPYGEHGWHPFMPHHQGQGRISICEYYAYRLAIRDRDTGFQFLYKLAQQYIVNTYLDIENSRLDYIRANQHRLRAEQYVGLADYLQRQVLQNELP